MALFSIVWVRMKRVWHENIIFERKLNCFGIWKPKLLKVSLFQNVFLVLLFGQKYQRNYFWISAQNFVISFWGLPGDLVFNIINKEANKKPQIASRKTPREVQKISGQKSSNNFVGILEEIFRPRGHFEINWPLAPVNCFKTHSNN